MALIECKECGKDMSSKADACPNCGYKKEKTGCLGMIGYIILGLFLIGLLGKCALDGDGKPPPRMQTSAPAAEQAVKDYFKVNGSDKNITCGTVVSISMKKDTTKVKDYLVNCSNKNVYRIIQEHTDLWKGKPADKWITHGFKCSDLKGSTIEGWQNPKDWGIAQENCSVK